MEKFLFYFFSVGLVGLIFIYLLVGVIISRVVFVRLVKKVFSSKVFQGILCFSCWIFWPLLFVIFMWVGLYEDDL